jgi:hypothetical protein
MDERCYFACAVTWNSEECFFLWFSDVTDGVVLDGDHIVTFPTRDELSQYCSDADLPLSNESTSSYDFDYIDTWIGDPENSEFHINEILNTWNMLDDFYLSILDHGAISDADLDLHGKLSLTSFSISMPGVVVDENYDAKWTSSDLSRLARILKEGTARFKAAL